MHLISYVESETGAHFLPPTSWVDDEFTWLCALDGRHYARIASLDYGEQATGIDLRTHDLAVETDLAVRLAALPAETEALIERWLAIKADHPKPELLPAPAVSE